MNVVVAGFYAGFPVAGLFWHAVSYALGFRQLGHEVWFLDDSGDTPWGYDFELLQEDPGYRYGSRRMAAEMAAVGLGERWMLRHAPTDRWDGLGRDSALEVLAGADVLVNVSLTTPMRPEYMRIPNRLGIDTDPVFTQVGIRTGARVRAVADSCTRLFTFGRAPLPAQRPGDEWIPTCQPVPAAFWPVAPASAPGAPFSTITNWDDYPAVCWEGQRYGTKGDSLQGYLDLPRRTGQSLLVALGGDPRHQAELRESGWEVRGAVLGTSVTTGEYRAFIAASAGEIGFAKHGYVAARSGWFSDRTCGYLASGRPAVVQDTGWTDWLPSGEGLLAFTTPGQAASAIEEVAEDPEGHARAARKLVEEHFDAARVCAALLEAL